MTHAKRTIFATFLLLAVAGTAIAQDEPRRRGPGSAIEAARETLALTDEQVDQIREIRRERPPRNADRDEVREWRDSQNAKLQDVLTADQKAKVQELEAQRQQMRALAGAAILGLAEMERGRRPGAFDRTGDNRDRRGFGADRSQGRPGWNRGGFGQGRGRPGPRFSPRGGFRGGPWRGQRNRGGRGWNRD